MDEKYVKVDDIVEYCNTYSVYLQGKGQGVAQCTLRYVKEFAKENATDVQPVISGDNCIVCGHDVRKDNVYYDVNGETICESCARTPEILNAYLWS